MLNERKTKLTRETGGEGAVKICRVDYDPATHDTTRNVRKHKGRGREYLRTVGTRNVVVTPTPVIHHPTEPKVFHRRLHFCEVRRVVPSTPRCAVEVDTHKPPGEHGRELQIVGGGATGKLDHPLVLVLPRGLFERDGRGMEPHGAEPRDGRGRGTVCHRLVPHSHVTTVPLQGDARTQWLHLLEYFALERKVLMIPQALLQGLRGALTVTGRWPGVQVPESQFVVIAHVLLHIVCALHVGRLVPGVARAEQNTTCGARETLKLREERRFGLAAWPDVPCKSKPRTMHIVGITKSKSPHV
eukprot:Hpha_TRINITY_DN8606_c0_g1::TRINITY_DN8606_c0_g1_i1::g.168659::m.168659